MFNKDRNKRQLCVCVSLKGHTHFRAEEVMCAEACPFCLLWTQLFLKPAPPGVSDYLAFFGVYVFAQNLPAVLCDVNAPGDRVALWEGPF